MSQKNIEKEACIEFLEFIRYSIAVEPMSTDWF